MALPDRIKKSIDAVTNAASFRFSYDPKTKLLPTPAELAAHARRTHFTLFFAGLSVQQRPLGLRTLRRNRQPSRSHSFLLPVRSNQGALQRNDFLGHPQAGWFPLYGHR